jgi:hypothetical protein
MGFICGWHLVNLQMQLQIILITIITPGGHEFADMLPANFYIPD